MRNCRLLGAVEISQIALGPSFAAGMLKNRQGMLVADAYILCLKHNMLMQCSSPPTYAFTYARKRQICYKLC